MPWQGSRLTWRVTGVHDHDRTHCVLGAGHRDGAEWQAHEATVSTTTDHQHLGLAADIEQHLRGTVTGVNEQP